MSLTTYKRKDMVYDDYFWKSTLDHDDPDIRHFPDNTLFNRHEGYEMLHLINACAKVWGWEGYPLADYQRLERLLREQLPGNVRGRDRVVEWLARHK